MAWRSGKSAVVRAVVRLAEVEGALRRLADVLWRGEVGRADLEVDHARSRPLESADPLEDRRTTDQPTCRVRSVSSKALAVSCRVVVKPAPSHDAIPLSPGHGVPHSPPREGRRHSTRTGADF